MRFVTRADSLHAAIIMADESRIMLEDPFPRSEITIPAIDIDDPFHFNCSQNPRKRRLPSPDPVDITEVSIISIHMNMYVYSSIFYYNEFFYAASYFGAFFSRF